MVKYCNSIQTRSLSKIDQLMPCGNGYSQVDTELSKQYWNDRKEMSATELN